MVGKRLDICEQYSLEKECNELRCSEGKVILVSNGFNIIKVGSKTACYTTNEVVMIFWDTNPGRNEVSMTSAQCLMTSKWDQKGCYTEVSWRMDIETYVDRHR